MNSGLKNKQTALTAFPYIDIERWAGCNVIYLLHSDKCVSPVYALPPAMSPPPWFDFTRFKYTATVRHPFTCYVYSAPLNAEGIGGEPTDIFYRAGDIVDIAKEVHQTMEYVAVRTTGGWINVWRARNRSGQWVGVNFCDIDWEWK